MTATKTLLIIAFAALPFGATHAEQDADRLVADFDKAKFCNPDRLNKSEDQIYFYRKNSVSTSELNLGDIEVTTSHEVDARIHGVFLFVSKNLSLKSAYCGNSICISKQEVKALCPGTRTYYMPIRINPSLFGPGKFQENVSFLFNDKDGDENEKFASLTGTIHAPRSEVQGAKEEVFRFLKGQSRTLRIAIKNTGDRRLEIGDFSEIKNTEKIQLKENGCSGQAVRPGQYCILQFESQATSSENSKTERSYDAAFTSNDVSGMGRLVMSINVNNEVRFGIWGK